MASPSDDLLPTVYVDGKPIDSVPGPDVTGAQLLAAAGHDADRVALYADGHNGRRILPGETVPVQEGSRFVTGPR